MFSIDDQATAIITIHEERLAKFSALCDAAEAQHALAIANIELSKRRSDDARRLLDLTKAKLAELYGSHGLDSAKHLVVPDNESVKMGSEVIPQGVVVMRDSSGLYEPPVVAVLPESKLFTP